MEDLESTDHKEKGKRKKGKFQELEKVKVFKKKSNADHLIETGGGGGLVKRGVIFLGYAHTRDFPDPL